MDKNIDNKSVKTEDPFLTKNVWIKRLGLFILIVGMYPTLLSSEQIDFWFKVIVGLCILTYCTKHIIDFVKTFHY